jgi:hypothetical protein
MPMDAVSPSPLTPILSSAVGEVRAGRDGGHAAVHGVEAVGLFRK